MRRRTVQPEIRSFFFRYFDPLSRHLTEVKRSRRVRILRRMRTVSESATSWQRKVWTQRHFRGEKLRCKFLARKSAKLFANFSVWARPWKVQTSSPISALLRWRHFCLSLSLSLSLSLYLSLSPSAPHAQYRKRFRASYNNFHNWESFTIHKVILENLLVSYQEF